MKKINQGEGVDIKSFLSLKILKVMRITLTLLFLATLQLFAGNSYSQSTKLSLNLYNASIENVLDEIEQQSEFYFVLNYKLVDVERRVDIQTENQPISEVLTSVFSGSDVDYLVLDRQILLSPKSYLNGIKSKIQSIPVTGTVTDEDRNPIPGVNITIKGTALGTISDANGKYIIYIEDPNTTLVFSFIGMLTQEVQVGDQTEINITLDRDAIGIEEVIAIGYGTMKRSDMTGSVSSINMSDIENTKSNTIAGILQGRAAGVGVTTADGSPGGGINIRIRGTSSINSSTEPLYIIDGFPVSSDNNDLYVSGGQFEGSSYQKSRPNALAIINPNDIESIEILKDAAATTIYGSRGANGVVLIKTKRGKAGKSNVNINYSGGVQTLIKKFERPTGPEYAQWINEREVASGNLPRYDGSSTYFPTPANANTTDWQDVMYSTAPTNTMSLSFSGGSDKTQFLLSGKYFDQEGILLGTAYKDIQTRLNIDHEVSDAIKVGANFLVSHAVNNQVPTGGLAGLGVNQVPNILSQSPVHNPDWLDKTTGLWWTDPYAFYETTDPYNYVTSISDILTTNRLLSNGFLDVKFLKHFNFHSTFGIDHSDAERELYYPRTIQAKGSPINNGSGSVNRVVIDRLMGNGYFSYNQVFEDHSLSAVIGTEAITQTRQMRNLHAENFTSDAQTTYNMGEGLDVIRVGTGQTKWQNLGFFGRVNYSYKSKYLLSVNFRYDGASQFGEDNKWAFFPAVATAWRITEEDFMAGQNIFSNLKLRLSVGQTGNGFINSYSSLGTWSINGMRYSYDDALVAGARLTRMANPELKWETTTQYNLGLDFGFLKNRLSFNLDLYSKITDDLILNVVIPRSSGFSSATQNVGSLENKGAELSINWVVVDKEFRYDFDVRGAYNSSEITDLGIPDEFKDEQYIEVASWEHYGGMRLYEGRPAGEIYGFIIDGTFATQEEADAAPDHGSDMNHAGYQKYRDVNGDGMITHDDQALLGNGQPDFFFGTSHNFAWKNFDLSIFFQGAFGNQIAVMYDTDDWSDRVANTWTASDPIDKKYAVNTVINGYQSLNMDSHMIYNGDYLRMKNITFGYNLPVQNVNWVSKVRIYFTGTNLLTFTNYPGYNPDISSGGTAAFSEGFDAGAYPVPKTCIFGVNLKF